MLRDLTLSALLCIAPLAALACSEGSDAEMPGHGGQGGASGTTSSSGAAARGGTDATAGSTATGGGTSGSGGASAGGGGAGGVGGEPPPVIADCPDDHGTAYCTEPGKRCAVLEGCCVCRVELSCGSEPAWLCYERSTEPECGDAPPAEGSPCPTRFQRCRYCLDDTDLTIYFCNAELQWQLGGLPGCT